MQIREALAKDFDAIWSIFHAVVASGDTYALDIDTNKDDAHKIWMEAPRKTFVVEQNGKIQATYFIKSNHSGPASHVCNCGYMVSEDARGKGLATIMCDHSQKVAVELGYLAMQFNLVVSSNIGAVKLWKKLGFNTVGTVSKAFKHPKKGFVDAFIMYKWLG